MEADNIFEACTLTHLCTYTISPTSIGERNYPNLFSILTCSFWYNDVLAAMRLDAKHSPCKRPLSFYVHLFAKLRACQGQPLQLRNTRIP